MQFTCLLLTVRSKRKMGWWGSELEKSMEKPTKFVLTLITIVLKFVVRGQHAWRWRVVARVLNESLTLPVFNVYSNVAT